MDQIRPWLWVGNQHDTQDLTTLQTHHISAMLQLHRHIKQPNIQELFIPIEEGYPIPPYYIKQAMAFVIKAKAAGHVILVACGAGISRSVIFATAALKIAENLTLPQAFSEVLKRHAKAMPDEVHWQSMNDYFGENTDYWEMWRTITL
ncbi:MAG: hypothetical protein Kow00117_12520 [Phototrophicales bacterium]